MVTQVIIWKQLRSSTKTCKVNYNKSGNTKYVANEGGTTTISLQDVTPGSKTYGQFTEVETISTNDALARRGLDIFGGGYVEKASSETAEKNTVYNPGGDNVKVKQKKADIISQIDVFDKRGLNQKTVEELQAMLDKQGNKIKNDIKPRIFPKRPGLNIK